MEFVGRVDPVRKLKGWLAGEGLHSPVSIISVSGPGGIGKTVLLEHANHPESIGPRNYMRLRLAGVGEARTLGQIVCHDLPQSCSQLDPAGKGYFIETRANLAALRHIDDQARAEVEAKVGEDSERRQLVLDVFRFGSGLQSLLPDLKKHIDLTKVKEEHVDAVLSLLEKANAYRQERRLFGGQLPDILGRGRRNRLRAGGEAAIADGLVADLSAILRKYRDKDSLKPMPSKVPGLDRLLLIVDDFESLAETLNPFLGDHLVPLLSRASFETVIVILGRDRLSDTHPVWRQRHESRLVGELRLAPFSREEGESFVRSRGISAPATVSRILDEPAGYPYLLAGEVEAELDGGRTALGLKAFYARTTRWMTPAQRIWLAHLCFLDDIFEETIALMLPHENSTAVLNWFKTESSVRSPTATRWEVLPIIRSRICSYFKLDSPKRFRELQERALRAAKSMEPEGTT